MSPWHVSAQVGVTVRLARVYSGALQLALAKRRFGDTVSTLAERATLAALAATLLASPAPPIGDEFRNMAKAASE